MTDEQRVALQELLRFLQGWSEQYGLIVLPVLEDEPGVFRVEERQLVEEGHLTWGLVVEWQWPDGPYRATFESYTSPEESVPFPY